MKEPSIADDLAAHRALESLPEPWLDLAQGHIDPAQALEAMRSQEPAELAERSARMFTPPSREQIQARLDAILATHFSRGPDERTASREPDVASLPDARTRRRPSPWLLAALPALAAILLLLLLPSSRPPFAAGYTLDFQRSLAQLRGSEAEAIPRYREDRDIAVVLRPADRIEGPVDVRVFARGRDGHVLALPVRPVVNESGVIDLLGSAEAWGLDVGTWELTFVIGRPGDLPDRLPGARDRENDVPYETRTAVIEVVGREAHGHPPP